ncbi:MAG: tRNA (guanosine(37)-N1)-methyltransferase TrmD [Peptococcaceae bacterium]|nr:tRNA (guanosine(37)-N1)-methyltransferase TrmD [Peptococcaceae bacterium]
MDIHVFSIFPEMFEGPLNTSILKRARQSRRIFFEAVNYRDYSSMKHQNVDDSPYGGGAGMVLKPEPIYHAVEDVLGGERYKGKILLMTPQGRVFNQSMARSLAGEPALAFICGHYEGFDERVRCLADEEISIGDYILTGGELCAMVVIDAVCRLLPGVLGAEESTLTDSFSDGLLEYPQYTRPREFRGQWVPETLLSGNHEQIRLWKRRESLKRTFLRRREMLAKVPLSDEDQRLLEDIYREEERRMLHGFDSQY